MKIETIIERNCAICGKKIKIKLLEWDNFCKKIIKGGYYFDIKGEREYWECPKCYKK